MRKALLVSRRKTSCRDLLSEHGQARRTAVFRVMKKSRMGMKESFEREHANMTVYHLCTG